MKLPNLHRIRDFGAGAITTALVLGLLIPAGAAMTSKTIQVLTGAEIYVDGVELNPTDANGKPVETFVYNGTTYVPLRAVSQSLGKAVNWDGENQRVYIGEAPGMKQYLNTVCPPYQTSEYYTPVTVSMAGKKYANVMRLGWDYGSGWAMYNLNGQYSTLDFVIGHIDGRGMTESTLNIYLDGELSFSLDVYPEDLPQEVSVPLHKALQMKIELTGHNDFAMAEVEIH